MRNEGLRRSNRILLAGLLGAIPLVALGANSVLVKVKVIVVAPPPCTINSNKVIEVAFGNVMTTRLDGVNYRVPVNYTVSCTGGSRPNIKIQILGSGADFDGTVLRTNRGGLGIELQAGKNKFPINTWLSFSYPQKPELWAVPVQQPGVSMYDGQFSAAATMTLGYQ